MLQFFHQKYQPSVTNSLKRKVLEEPYQKKIILRRKIRMTSLFGTTTL